MKIVVHAAALALALGWPTVLATQAFAQTGKISVLEGAKGDGGYWKTTFGLNPEKPLTPEHSAVRDRMMQHRVLEEYVEFLSPVRWPHALKLLASDCSGNSGDSTYYARKYYFINMCYPYVALAEKAADFLVQVQTKQKLWTPVNRDQLIAGMFVATLVHETGHAAFDIMDIPVFGREEDAADQMAGFIALQFGKETARTVVKGRAYLFAYESLWLKWDPPLSKPDTRSPNYPKDPDAQCYLDPFCAYSDEHGTDSQRMYNILCIAYGGDPDNFKDLVDARWLPADRAKSCAGEYQRIKLAFSKTVYPFIDQEQMKKVQGKAWFEPKELKEK